MFVPSIEDDLVETPSLIMEPSADISLGTVVNDGEPVWMSSPLLEGLDHSSQVRETVEGKENDVDRLAARLEQSLVGHGASIPRSSASPRTCPTYASCSMAERTDIRAVASDPDVCAIVLAFGEEPFLESCISALRESLGVRVQIVVVNNGCSNPRLGDIVRASKAILVEPARNLGFTSGCNEGARRANAPTLAFINSDAIVAPDCLQHLVNAVRDPEVGLASAMLTLADEPDRVNSVGNPVHVSGLSWAGGYRDLVKQHLTSRDVASVTGGAMAVRTDLWRDLGGFWDPLFAYLEDTEISLRCWQRGLRVRYVAEARAQHHYEFSRNENKMFLLERNRTLLLLTMWQARTLVRLAPVLAVVEVLLFALSMRQGWSRAKIRGWRWIISHRKLVRERRRNVQARRSVADSALFPLLTCTIDATNVARPPGLGLVNLFFGAWCRIAFIRRSRSQSRVHDQDSRPHPAREHENVSLPRP